MTTIVFSNLANVHPPGDVNLNVAAVQLLGTLLYHSAAEPINGGPTVRTLAETVACETDAPTTSAATTG
jgi:hypothetical protein